MTLTDAPLTDEETVRLEQKLFRKRRRAGRRSRLRRYLVALLVVVLLGAGVYVVGFSPLLAVDHVEVTGTEQLAPVVVEHAAQVPVGRPLARVDLAAIQARVAAIPAVDSVRVSRAWPHGVRIAVTERVPVALVARGSGFRALSADGVLFSSSGARPADLPVIRDETGGKSGSDALREAAEVAGALSPAVLARVEHLTVRSVDDVSLVLRTGRVVVWGNSGDSGAKAEVLGVMIKRPWRVLDVSVPGRPTTR